MAQSRKQLSHRNELMAQMGKNLPAKQKTPVRSLGQEDPLACGMATYSSILAWRIPWMEEPGGLESMESKKSWTQLSTYTTSSREAEAWEERCLCLRTQEWALITHQPPFGGAAAEELGHPVLQKPQSTKRVVFLSWEKRVDLQTWDQKWNNYPIFKNYYYYKDVDFYCGQVFCNINIPNNSMSATLEYYQTATIHLWNSLKISPAKPGTRGTTQKVLFPQKHTMYPNSSQGLLVLSSEEKTLDLLYATFWDQLCRVTWTQEFSQTNSAQQSIGQSFVQITSSSNGKIIMNLIWSYLNQ